MLFRSGLLDSDGRPRTADGSSDWYNGSPEQRTKTRHSLYRTLREGRESTGSTGQLYTLSRNRKGRDSGSATLNDDNAIAGTDGNTSQAASTNGSPLIGSSGNSNSAPVTKANERSEILPRSRGSFTVHGKKASVITFGADWQKGPAEQRLRARKMSAATESKPQGTSSPLSVTAETLSLSGTDSGIDATMTNSSTATATEQNQTLRNQAADAYLRPRPTSLVSSISGQGGDASARSSLMDVHKVMDTVDETRCTGPKATTIGATAQAPSANRGNSELIAQDDSVASSSEASGDEDFYEDETGGRGGADKGGAQVFVAKTGAVFG